MFVRYAGARKGVWITHTLYTKYEAVIFLEFTFVLQRIVVCFLRTWTFFLSCLLFRLGILFWQVRLLYPAAHNNGSETILFRSFTLCSRINTRFRAFFLPLLFFQVKFFSTVFTVYQQYNTSIIFCWRFLCVCFLWCSVVANILCFSVYCLVLLFSWVRLVGCLAVWLFFG